MNAPNTGQADSPIDRLGPERGAQDRALTRSSEAPLREGNQLTLLKNGPETFDEWLEEIHRAERWIHMDYFIFKSDGIGNRFAEAIMQKSREGVAVRVLYDWMGNFFVPRSFWGKMREAGIEVRVVNAPGATRTLELVARDHRKILAVDGRYASVGGLCIADQWLDRSPETGLPYRDTAVGVRGPAVADVERAFAGVWDRSGAALPDEERPAAETIPAAGEQGARVVIQEPGKMRMLRTLQLLTAGVEERLWISDAYFLSVQLLTQGLVSAARDGTDVRVLVPAPSTNDQPPIGTLSRAGYRRLLETGVRIFEYAGPMMHAKTNVADGRLSRVGSTNLNVSGLMTNWEIDLIAEDRGFGRQMEEMFEDDLADAREVVLESRGAGRVPRARPERPLSPSERREQRRPRSYAEPRALSTASRVGRAALHNSRESLRNHERSVVGIAAGILLSIGAAGMRFPKLLAWPISALLISLGATGLLRAAQPDEGRPVGPSTVRR